MAGLLQRTKYYVLTGSKIDPYIKKRGLLDCWIVALQQSECGTVMEHSRKGEQSRRGTLVEHTVR